MIFWSSHDHELFPLVLFCLLLDLLIFQFNEEARSPFVKKYKTIIHPGEVWVMNYADKLKMPNISSTFSVYMFALWFAWSITPLWGFYAVSVGELSYVTQLHFPPNHPRALTMPWKCCLHNGCNLPNCSICLFITFKLMSMLANHPFWNLRLFIFYHLNDLIGCIVLQNEV